MWESNSIYVYAVRDEDIYVNLFAGGTGTVVAADQEVTMSQETDYPWDGRIVIRVDPQQPADLTLRIRIPGWPREQPIPSDLYRYADAAAKRAKLSVNGQPIQPNIEAGFAVITRRWEPGDRVQLELPMPVRRLLAHPSVEADQGRVALQRGPIVYCIEGVDHGGRVTDLYLPDGAQVRPEHQAEVLGGVTVLRG